MAGAFLVDDIIGSPCKLSILRLMASRKGFRETGREIARFTGFSVPSTHVSLKDLYAHDILDLEVKGKQHLYSLNEGNRLVQKVVRPIFEAEGALKEEIAAFICEGMKKAGVLKSVVSIILYGSLRSGEAVQGSDVDIAVMVSRQSDVEGVQEELSSLALSFRSYFGAQLDPYVKSATAFRTLLKENKPPVSTLMKAYSVLYGKEPLEV